MQNDVDIVLPDNISEYNTVINETFLKHAADKLMPVFVKMIKKYIQCNFLGNSFTFITTFIQ
jgi:hypothetical protein